MTIAHGLCGYLALALLARRWLGHESKPGVTIGDLRLAAGLVTAGAILDVLDGPVARRLGSSGLGGLLDGMCDTVTFGVVPAVLIAASGSARPAPASWALVGAGGVFLVAMILRLVRTEQTTTEAIGRGFRGLPSAPAAFVALCLVALNATPALTCLLVVVVAALMVGNYHYPRQQPALMPIMAGGLAIGLLGVWGVLPLRPVATVTMVSTIVLPVASGGAARRRRRSGVAR
jgi:CDP-diacylglycerol--serine O-phosphatidyltransferase